ncbi:NAD(P)/FAD-dependent oxidoreductase [Apilactobacillus timberlakei]|uniref:FAD-binding oxidoreductase n=1 Tax=Apilactobacillus timberlakei TaxID=2008380 RepID=A0ABY2YU15_9LACO|nr:FAD-dependent oxidoreductase [Apilactobacillus timberlakei]TPR13944.1 FAD-binding oxidoreductase [Apilactobacillus timberlakei]TPR15259.1 FAD-binding oxidoreductase [Apilactobacillus timberlakei]TPR17150.1 FAD-binding oxidoreductase [Apilactobacillus timberlakei]
MKKNIAIIGGGIVGSTAAYYLSKLDYKHEFNVTMYDDGKGQATKAAAGIISPWLSKRRNKKWYNLARDGATLLSNIAKETNMSKDIYDQCGTIITRDNQDKLNELYQKALVRTKETKTIGDVYKLNANEVKSKIPLLTKVLPGVLVTGGARIDGGRFTKHLKNLAQLNNLKIVNKKVAINDEGKIQLEQDSIEYDYIIIATGAWMKNTLSNLPLEVDVRAQKGQLIELSTNSIHSNTDMPVLMPEGERDFIPFSNGKLIVGATHENDKGFDLQPTSEVIDDLLASANRLVDGLNQENLVKIKVGTRAYTSDFAPFFGNIPQYENMLVGGGLGSSGLTTGPLIGKLLAHSIVDKNNIDLDQYRKPIANYIKKIN